MNQEFHPKDLDIVVVVDIGATFTSKDPGVTTYPRRPTPATRDEVAPLVTAPRDEDFPSPLTHSPSPRPQGITSPLVSPRTAAGDGAGGRSRSTLEQRRRGRPGGPTFDAVDDPKVKARESPA